MTRTGVAIVGCGNISAAYFQTLSLFDFVEVRACADVLPERAIEKARQHNVHVANLDEILKANDISLVINLTPPLAHAEVNLAAVRAGKHTYSEKPMAITVPEARQILNEAQTSGVVFGGATDTFLGGGHQETRRLIDSGAIGAPVAATAHMLLPGHERWHPDPFFFYRYGAGPMLDVGPYYVTNLIHLLGPVRRVCGMSKITRKSRKIENGPRDGEVISVDVPTHIAGVMEFVNGTLVNIATSFDVQRHLHNQIEIYGLEGSMVTPDPNRFGGTVKTFRKGAADWQEEPTTFSYTEGNLRGIGAADMAWSLARGEMPRASSDLALHALEVMSAIQASAETLEFVDIESTCGRPRPVKEGLSLGQWG